MGIGSLTPIPGLQKILLIEKAKMPHSFWTKIGNSGHCAQTPALCFAITVYVDGGSAA